MLNWVLGGCSRNDILSTAIAVSVAWKALHKAVMRMAPKGRHRLSLHHCGGGIMVHNDSDLVIDEIGYHFARV